MSLGSGVRSCGMTARPALEKLEAVLHQTRCQQRVSISIVHAVDNMLLTTCTMAEKYRHPFVKRRKLLKLTQQQIADAAGVRARAVQDWEAGKHQPKLTATGFAELCKLLKCSIEELASDFEELSQKPQ